MEVHPPHGSVHSIKDFMVHILAITIGLLMAQGLESTAEWWHHQSQVREARQNIAHEIRDNEDRVAHELASLPKEQDQLTWLMGEVSNREHGKAATPHEALVWTAGRLSESSWNTAYSTGAVAHMDYDEVRRYAHIYALQELFNSSMDKYLESRRDMYAFLTRAQLPDKPSAAEYEYGKRAIAAEMVTGQFLREIAETLRSSYTKESGEGR